MTSKGYAESLNTLIRLPKSSNCEAGSVGQILPMGTGSTPSDPLLRPLPLGECLVKYL